MAAVAEKARFYLEQAVPQLREFEAKGIFNPDEIRSLVRKRTDYEHIVLSPGNKAQDWLNYVAWERSLEALRTKRCRRLEIRASSKHVGEGRVFGILERAVSRHPGSLELWKEYLGYATKMRATKRYRKVMTRALRMHPAKSELWVLAGQRAASHGDMHAARGFFMRGSRFCTRYPTVWLAYAKCEMEWLAKMEARKGKKGGAEKAIAEQAEHDDDEIKLGSDDSDDDVDENGRLIMPNPDAAAAKNVFDAETTSKLKNNPALDGAIPLAIYDVAKKQAFFNAAVGEQFFDVFALFTEISVQPRIIQHVLDSMNELYPNDAATSYCYIRHPLISLKTDDPAYPKAVRETLNRVKSTLPRTTNPKALSSKLKSWLEALVSSQDLDVGIRTVLTLTIKTLPPS
ncbi:U3 small nucleolar RNA-associated protein 6-domain-containing protein [Xylaria bambusicola]|uniref:U3 small nucleolar RNA-associated protein 6-domain-containing protein n=1 Tax=Xylaria bambusicola TaxID=326684 RepID=UPI0020081397|nr:U3 small nucleolar RNA-associated protein 6-domain-containing protein [Xylaria bambusicola]KAI0509528.1 U3 small nucleolar RNA-associated protein 6-domain-containing protein [Xylaria bambusicola]